MEKNNNTDQAIKTKKYPTIEVLKQLKQDTSSFQKEHMQRVDAWNIASEAPKLKNIPDTRCSIQPKLIKRQAVWQYSNLADVLLNTPKLFKIDATSDKHIVAADQNERLLNWQFKTKINKTKFFRDMVIRIVDEGSVVIKLGWSVTTAVVKVDMPIYQYIDASNDPQYVEYIQQIAILKNTNPTAFEKLSIEAQHAIEYFQTQGIPVKIIKTGSKLVDKTITVEEKPTLDFIDLQNVFVDPTCDGDFSKAKFIIVQFKASKADLLRNKAVYNEIDNVDWEDLIEKGQEQLDSDSSYISNGKDINKNKTIQFKDTARKQFTCYEYWGLDDLDGSGKLEPIVMTWVGDTIIRKALNPYPDKKFPFVIATYMPIRGSVFGEPDAALIEDNQNITGALMRGIIDSIAKTSNGQVGFAKGFLDPEEYKKYLKGNTYQFNPVASPSEGIHTHSYPPLNTTAFDLIQMQSNEAEAITGIKSFNNGVSGNAYGQVATGIKGVLDAVGKREMFILANITEAIVELAAKITAMNQAFLSNEQVVRVTNAEFIRIQREDLLGNFYFSTELYTAEANQVKAETLAFLLQTLGKVLPPDLTTGLLAQICKLKGVYDYATILENYKPEPDPNAQKMAELEIAKAEAEVNEINARAAKLQAEAQLAASNKDMKDLDFVNNQTGVSHQRDMEKQQAQSEGNQNLKITEGILDPTVPNKNIAAALKVGAIDKLKEGDLLPTQQEVNPLPSVQGVQQEPYVPAEENPALIQGVENDATYS